MKQLIKTVFAIAFLLVTVCTTLLEYIDRMEAQPAW